MGKHEDILNLEVDPSHGNSSTIVVPPKFEKKSKIPGGKKKFPKKLVFIVGGIFIAAATAAIVLYITMSQVRKQDVDFEFSGSSTIQSGDEVVFKIGYANNNSHVTMQNAKLTLTPPKGFQFLSASLTPNDAKNLIWNLGEISPKTQQVIEVHAKFYGDVNTNVNLQGSLQFTPSSFAQSLTTTAVYSPLIAAPNVSMDLSAPGAADAGAQITYTLDVTNNDSTNFDGASVKLTLPTGFTETPTGETVSENAPHYDKSSDSWILGSIAPSQKQEILITGRLDGTTGEQKNIDAQLLLAYNGASYVQAETSKVTVISSPSVSIQQSVSLQYADPGQSVRFVLTVKNTGTSPLTNLTLEDDLDSQVIDLNSLSIDHGGVLKGSSVVWDNTVLDQLRFLNPNEQFQIGFSLAPYKNITVAGKEFSIISNPKITTGSQEVTGDSATVKIRTGLDVTDSSSVFDANKNPVGTGPTTPTVGKTTTYRLSWTITNRYNNLTNAKLVCNIPLGATYTGSAKTTPGTLVFDSTLKNVIWTIGSMNPKNDNPSNSTATGYFDVSITPSAPNQGNIMILAQNCEVTGHDDFIDQDMSLPFKDFVSDKVQ